MIERCPHCGSQKDKRARTSGREWLNHHLKKWCQPLDEQQGSEEPAAGGISDPQAGVLSRSPESVSDDGHGEAGSESPNENGEPPQPSLVHIISNFARTSQLSCKRTTELLELVHHCTSMNLFQEQIHTLPHTAAALVKRASCDSSFDQTIVLERLPSGQVFPHFQLRGVVEALLREFPEAATVPAAEPSELTSGAWYRAQREEIYRGESPRIILPIILYLDGIAVDFFGRISVTPLFVTLGSLPVSVRDTFRGKRLLGFVPAGPTKNTIEALDR